MPETYTVLKAFVASPGDLEEERALLEEIIRELNNTWSKHLRIIVELVKWETHAFPGMGADAQEVINKEIGDDYDIFIGILWARFGTATQRAESGTEEEFNRAYKRYKENPDQIRIMFYFKEADISPSKIDPDQLAAVNRFRKSLGKEGFQWSFVSRDDFEKALRMHLSRQVQDYGKGWGTGKAVAATPAEPGSIATTTELELRDSEALSDEEGILDLAEIASEQFAVLTEAAQRMYDAIQTLNGRLEERNREMESANKLKTAPDFKLFKKMANLTAEDLDHFSNRMEVEISFLNESFSKAINAIARTATFAGDFEAQDKEGVTRTINLIGELVNVFTATSVGVRGFRDTLGTWPRLTGVLNKAKRRAMKVLESLDTELGNALSLSIEAKKALEGMFGGVGEPAWEGVTYDGEYYAWAGPLLGLEDRPSAQSPAGLKEELESRGLRVGFGNPNRLSNKIERGRCQVFATDRKSWRRPIVNDSGQLLLVCVQENPA